METAVTVRLDAETARLLDKFCRQSRRNRSDVIREALRRQLSLQLFDQVREQIAPFAEARGYLTDEDVFRDIS
jgi:predicted transcriptional regulator